MTILAFGPLTNIASLVKKRPDLASRIDAVVAVAGQRPGESFKVGSSRLLHFHDLNFRKDPDAFQTVLETDIPIHLIPFEIGRQATITRDDLKSFKANGGLDEWMAIKSREWIDFWEDGLGADGFSPFDTVAVAYLLGRQHFSCAPLPAKVVRRRGIFVVRDTLEVAPNIAGGKVVTYCSQMPQVLRDGMADFFADPNEFSMSRGIRPMSDEEIGYLRA